ncbi:hypothetical protein AA0312_2205 [Acetobacter tropicalis NRIC 0312]|uniref:Uncharacterized protein n=1 Tax=Acetobacter tropicalis TaxID=104102 RepID=A0A511FL99_9PROT|nr:hypothetical protein ATR1_068d0108 [Acetobacter tropicalis]GBR71223.1 hypothetical protein AA0312_2205 [Acetobacter tropicalis NRIC 0312]GEL50003.1 hypothetical protein ATR01nite_10780 [Acetobacter tropicalis]
MALPDVMLQAAGTRQQADTGIGVVTLPGMSFSVWRMLRLLQMLCYMVMPVTGGTMRLACMNGAPHRNQVVC